MVVILFSFTFNFQVLVLYHYLFTVHGSVLHDASLMENGTACFGNYSDIVSGMYSYGILVEVSVRFLYVT